MYDLAQIPLRRLCDKVRDMFATKSRTLSQTWFVSTTFVICVYDFSRGGGMEFGLYQPRLCIVLWLFRIIHNVIYLRNIHIFPGGYVPLLVGGIHGSGCCCCYDCGSAKVR